MPLEHSVELSPSKAPPLAGKGVGKGAGPLIFLFELWTPFPFLGSNIGLNFQKILYGANNA